ncbi:MAG TPA: DinB family protein [Pyrinomonadaceae bacterium]|nr:DinB family protein [Pyrinomonadaceae bacterium]
MTDSRSDRLEDALAELRATRERTLALADRLTQREFDRAPGRGGWSVGEVLDHVLLAERLNRDHLARLIELKRSGRRPELRLNFSDVNVSVAYLPRSVLPLLQAPLAIMNAFVPDRLRSYLTRNRLVPFQNPDQAAPRSGRSAAQLRGDLIASFRETEELLRANPDLDYAEMFIQHPLLGSYDAPGLLRFMSAHEQRHQSQMADILSRPRTRRSA